MNKYTFATQTGKAYYCNSVPAFILDNPNEIIGSLVRKSFGLNDNQIFAWENQIRELQSRLQTAGIIGDIIFEYDIIRLGKRIDVILLVRHMVFSLEFKNGIKKFNLEDEQQAEDYALDLKNFHKESEDLYVCPILIATNAKPYPKKQVIDTYPDKQVFLQRENIDSLIPKIIEIVAKYGDDENIDFEKWFNSPYYPTPTIIAAAIEAYNTHDITEIAHSKADQGDIKKCENRIFELIDKAKDQKKKIVCFVTGVPGAGKTLVGLNVAVKHLKREEENHSVYISGNGPLVEVLKAALIKSVKRRNKEKGITQSEGEIKAAVSLFIQGSYGFKKDNARKVDPTTEHVLVFDEAQRVWNKEKMTKKHKSDPNLSVSEPHLLYSIMDRHPDWAVMICLVGLGQDIYDGEVGINEWFKCGITEFKNWEMYYSPDIFSHTVDKSIDRKMIEECPRCFKEPLLHLNTPIRSFKSNKQSLFVDALLNGDNEKARNLYKQMTNNYEVYITRNIQVAKKWVRKKPKGSERCGMLASSGAKRLQPEGVYVPVNDFKVTNWFLSSPNDIRSSNMLEIAASEFKVQGLEIDWSIVCWDADLRRVNGKWEFFKFSGTKWNERKSEEQKRYLLNSYRVLLTRARQGMVIFVPNGVDKDEDPTRDQSFYDSIYNYLKSCGIRELDSSTSDI